LARGGRLPIDLLGTSFQVQVWAAILDLPEDVPYGALAKTPGRPAARAVGQAVGVNPLAWVLPCYRVVSAQGGTLGYRWGRRRARPFAGASRADGSAERLTQRGGEVAGTQRPDGTDQAAAEDAPHEPRCRAGTGTGSSTRFPCPPP
jgi:O-6-methylguanine DNA methyltransferase